LAIYDSKSKKHHLLISEEDYAKSTVRNDEPELFKTIEKNQPYAN